MDLKAHSWYFGLISRGTSESLLKIHPAGTYLMRDSRSCPGDFVLSVSESGRVSHYIITKRGDQYHIGNQVFSDLLSILEFYKTHYLDTTYLTQVCPKEQNSFTSHTDPIPPLPHPNSVPSQNSVPSFQTHVPPASAPSSASMSSSVPAAPQVASQPTQAAGEGRIVVKALYEFTSNDPEDLCFKKGEIMYVINKDEEQWWTVRHANGRVGQVPVPYIQVVSEPANQQPEPIQPENQPVLARATRDRMGCPYDQKALSFKVGDIILVTKRDECGVWEGELNGKKGHFPFNHVQLLDEA